MLEVLKLVTAGAAGYGLKWVQGKLFSRAAEVRDILKRLDTLLNEAEVSHRGRLTGNPDQMLANRVNTEHRDLGIAISRTLGRCDGYAAVSGAQTLLSQALLPADPISGLAPEHWQADVMRERQQQLRAAIHQVVERMLFWRLYRYDQPK